MLWEGGGGRGGGHLTPYTLHPSLHPVPCTPRSTPYFIRSTLPSAPSFSRLTRLQSTSKKVSFCCLPSIFFPSRLQLTTKRLFYGAFPLFSFSFFFLIKLFQANKVPIDIEEGRFLSCFPLLLSFLFIPSFSRLIKASVDAEKGW